MIQLVFWSSGKVLLPGTWTSSEFEVLGEHLIIGVHLNLKGEGRPAYGVSSVTEEWPRIWLLESIENIKKEI